MRSTKSDTTTAVILAVGLHILIFGALFFGFLWSPTSKQVSAAGSPVSAELMSTSDLSRAMQRELAKDVEPAPQPEPEPLPEPEPEPEETQTVPQPLPEPTPQDSPVPTQQQAQERVPDPEPVQQEKVDRNAVSEETRKKEQEEKRKQEQIDLTEEREKQAEAERKQRLAKQQEELNKIRAEKEKLKREANLAEQKLKQLADRKAQQAAQQAADASANSAPPPPGNNGVDEGLLAQYQAAIQRAVLSNWTRPDNVPLGQRCRITIKQRPGGEVIEAKVAASCPFDEQGKRSVEAAVLKAQPLPYAGFESVFNRTLNFNFEAQDR